MVISHKYKILFIHIPKTGGTFIFDVLKSVDGDLEIIWDDRYSNIEYTHHAIPSEELIKKYKDDGYYVFCIIRDPYELIISFYSYIKSNPNHITHMKVKNMSFFDFLKTETLNDEKYPDYISKNYVYQKIYVNKHVNVFLFDDLIDNFTKILKKSGVKNVKKLLSSIENRNKSNHKGIKHTEETIKQLLSNHFFMDDVNFYNKLKNKYTNEKKM